MLNVYRASAGSGKTYRLTYEYIKMLLGRYDVDHSVDAGGKSTKAYKFYDNYNNPHRRILAVTFTNKATSEMKQRIVDELNILAYNTEESDYCKDLCSAFSCGVAELQRNVTLVLQQLLHDFSYFNVSTIDSFFQQVLRAFTREVGLQGGYDVEMDSDYVTSAAIDRMFEDLDNNESMLNWLVQYAEASIKNDGSWNIHDKSEIPDLAKQLTSEAYKKYSDKLSQNSLELYKDYIKTLENYRDEIRTKIADVAATAKADIAAKGIDTEFFTRGWIKLLDVLSDPKQTDISNGSMGKAVATFEKYYPQPQTWIAKSKLKKSGWSVDELVDCLLPILAPVSTVLSGSLIEYRSIAPALKYIYSLGVLSTIDDNIKKYEQEHNTLLLNKTPEILSGLINESDAPFIYEKVGTRVAHYMIDEFQDTSGMQWRNFEPLVAESLAWRNENLIVGDVKQSIYRFRNSDWRLLHEGLETYNYSLVNSGYDTNWRSCADVIAFNNSFFNCAAGWMQAQLQNEKTRCAQEDNQSIPCIDNIFKGVEQKVSPKHRDHSGHVELHILDVANKEIFRTEMRKRISDTLQNLLAKGYRQKDIAFLMRTGREGRELVELLLAISTEGSSPLRKDLRVVSDESLLIMSAPPVKLILGILRYLQNPNFPINELVLAYEYDVMNHTGSSDALVGYFDKRVDSLPIDAELQTFIKEISAKPLFEMCEMIIHKFAMHRQSAYMAYIEAFQDVVIDYCRNHSADLYTFLRWWDESGSSATVKTPENIDAIKVLTIHKSKGLEFPVVIIPYATWKIFSTGGGKHSSIKWYQPDRAPFNLLPVLPIEHKSELASTIFAGQYCEELANEYIDCINLLYVAFTRASQELIVYTYPGKNTVGQIIGESLVLAPPENDECPMMSFASHIATLEGETVLETGKDWMPIFDDKPLAKQLDVTYNVVVPTESRLKQHTQSRTTSGDRKRNYGILMHEILADIYTADDIAAVVQRCVREGRLKNAKAQKTEEKIRGFIAHPMAQRWFSPDVRIVTETDILKSGKKVNRPDRIVIDGDRVTVVDYKFGWVEDEDYNKKVSEYMQLIRDMGYKQVEGCIWYVEKDKFVPVE